MTGRRYSRRVAEKPFHNPFGALKKRLAEREKAEAGGPKTEVRSPKCEGRV